MRKLMACFLTMVLFTFTLAGCSNDGSGETVPDSTISDNTVSGSTTSDTGTSNDSSEPDSAPKELTEVTVRLKWIHQAQFAGFYAADQLGYYEEAGLKVNIQPGGSDFPAVQMVAAGDEQFGVTGADQILMSREKGVKIKAISTFYRDTPFVLFTLKSSGITDLNGLKGETVGVKLGGNEELTYRAMLKSAGIDGSEMNEMPVKFDLSPLLTGQVAAWPGYLINEVIAAQEQGEEVNIIYPRDYGINFYADTLFTTEKYAGEHPQVVDAFVKATMKGWQYAIDHPGEAAEFSLKYGTDLVYDHELAMMKASIPLLEADRSPLGVTDEESWTALQESLLDLGFMEKPFDNINDVFTNEYLD